MANIKGFAIRGLFRYLKETNPSATAGVISKLPAELKPIFERPIVASNMYPYRAFAEILRGIDRQVGKGDLRLCEEIGDFAARQDINGMFKMMMTVLSPKTIVERSPIFWSKYCDTGKLVPLDSNPQHSIMRMEGFPEMDEAHCHLMNGWITRFALMTKAQSVVVKHSVCIHRGGSACEWAGSWN